MDKPTCRLCGSKHWGNEPHAFGDTVVPDADPPLKLPVGKPKVSKNTGFIPVTPVTVTLPSGEESRPKAKPKPTATRVSASELREKIKEIENRPTVTVTPDIPCESENTVTVTPGGAVTGRTTVTVTPSPGEVCPCCHRKMPSEAAAKTSLRVSAFRQRKALIPHA
jgi:hypothetical protein